MLSFKYSLSEEQRWQLVHYIRELARLYPPQTASVPATAKKSGENAKAAQLGISGSNQDQSISTFESKGYLITDNYFISTVIGALVVMLITLVVLIYTLMVVMMAVKN